MSFRRNEGLKWIFVLNGENGKRLGDYVSECRQLKSI